MKLLMFVLGSVKTRFSGFGDFPGSYNEEDIVFFGPIPEKEYIYNGRKFKIIQVFQETSIFDIISKLSPDWHPDVVHCETPVLCYVPDIHKSPYIIYLNTRDAWGEMIYNRGIIELSDASYYQSIDIEAYRGKNTVLVPIVGGPTSYPNQEYELRHFRDRPIDVLMIANYGSGFYHPRYKLMFKVAERFAKTYNVKFLKGIAKDRIHDYYSQAKIVIDFSYVMSNRSYEAALNKCLFFSFEKNPLIKEIWEPNKEYVPFNFEDIYEKISFYLSNEDNAQTIVDNAYAKLQKLPCRKERLTWILSQDIDPQDRINRVDRMCAHKLSSLLTTPLLFNYVYGPRHNHPDGWLEIYNKRVSEYFAYGDTTSREYISTLIEAARLFLLMEDYQKSMQFLEILKTVMPNYAWLYYIDAIIIGKDGNNEIRKLELLEKAITVAESNQELLNEYPLPLAEKNDEADGRRIGQYMWDTVGVKIMCSQYECLMYKCYFELGNIYCGRKNSASAIECYLKAFGFLNTAECTNVLAELLIEKKAYKDAYKVLHEGITENPYDMISNLRLIQCLSMLKGVKSSREYVFNQYVAYKCFNTKQFGIFKNFMLLLLFLPPLSRHMIKYVVNILIILTKKINSFEK